VAGRAGEVDDALDAVLIARHEAVSVRITSDV
jgi:hypothetical protein